MSKVKEDFKKISAYTIEALMNAITKEKIDRKGHYHLFGYDFIFDEDFNTYLIEING